MVFERFRKKQVFEFCEIKNIMVRLDVIQSTARMPDFVHAEAKLMPVGCNNARGCRREGVRCIVFDRNGQDPCPEVWKGEF